MHEKTHPKHTNAPQTVSSMQSGSRGTEQQSQGEQPLHDIGGVLDEEEEENVCLPRTCNVQVRLMCLVCISCFVSMCVCWFAALMHI